MPLYEYKCVKCDTEFEVLVRNSDERIICPDCDSGECERKFSVFGFSAGNKFVSSANTGPGCSGCHSHNCKDCK